MINQNNTEYNGPILGTVKLKPLVYKSAGGNPSGLLPPQGYLSSSTSYGNYSNADQGGSYPPLDTNVPTNTGKNIYEPARIPFVHKFGGPHCSVTGEVAAGSFNDNSTTWYKEEFLRIKLPKGTDTLSPYTCATLTGTIFPYGQTNTGSISPLGNRTATSLFRHKFNFIRAKPSSQYSVDLYSYNNGAYAPLYNSSLINQYHGDMRTKEFQLDTDPSVVQESYGSQTCLRDGNIDALSIHPEVSEGDCDNFNLPGNFPQGDWDPVLGGITPWFDGITPNTGINELNYATANLIYLRMQGTTDGNDVSFVCIAKRGSVIKGIIELY